MAMTEADIAANVAATEANMVASGVSLTDSAEVDYFAPGEEHKVWLPDGKQWVLVKELSEGEKRKYQNALSRDAKIQKATGDTLINLRPGDERYNLLRNAICGWHLVKGGVEFPYIANKVDLVLETFPPKVIDVVEKAVRKYNTWTLNDFTVEDIDKQIAELQEMREQKVREDEGNAVSSSK